MQRRGWERWVGLLMWVALVGLYGCGTPYATVANSDGRPVMLLGHDPVAYFTRQQPLRGDPALRVGLPQRSY